MAKLVKKTTISIGGTEVKQFYQLTLNQGIFAHHMFKLTCPAEAVDGPKGSLLSNSKNFIGQPFTVKIDGHEKGGTPLQFAGVVTQVESTRFDGHSGDLVISGYSPTLLMDNGPHCKSWAKKALKNIAEDVCSHFASNLLSPKIKPKNKETFSYTVQYKETAWQFLNRMAATHGEWFFYDGKNLLLGNPEPKTASLIYGATLSNFNLSLEARPVSFSQKAYDYINHETYHVTPEKLESEAGLDPNGKHVLGKAKEIFPGNPIYFNNTFTTNEKQLRQNTEVRAAAQASNLVRFSGTSSHFGVQLGNTVKVDNNIGSYKVIEVTHFADGNGHYHNEFVGIPSSLNTPPIVAYNEPFCESQSAIVTDNHDKSGFGRVRLRFHWMKPSQKTPWLRITSPHGGGDKGMHFIPEKGEEVIVGFEGNSPTKGFVIGTTYHGKAKQSYGGENNDKKAIRTRSGIEILMDDSDGSVTIIDPSGNTINMDGKKNITISCPETFTVSAKDINMVASNNVGIAAKETFIGTGKVVGISADTDLTANGKKVLVNGGDEATVSTPKLKLSGKETTLDSNKATLSASGDMTITGGLIKINS
jgi:type VI secretion system secreted protein VgrG